MTAQMATRLTLRTFKHKTHKVSIVSANGPQLVSDKTEYFKLQVHHTTSYKNFSSTSHARVFLMVKPSLTARMQGKQEAAKDRGKEKRAFTPGDASFRGSDKWNPGIVMQRLGPVSYMVRVNEQLRHVYIGHLIR